MFTALTGLINYTGSIALRVGSCYEHFGSGEAATEKTRPEKRACYH